jgi:hypothetical protein
MRPNRQETITLFAGNMLSIDATTTAGTTGSIVRLPDNPGGGEPYSPVAINGSNVYIGPFNTNRRYLISCTTGDIQLSQGQGDPQISGVYLYSSLSGNGLLGVLPPNCTLLHAVVRETTGNAVSISLATTSGGTDIAGSTPIAIPAGGQVLLTAMSFDLDWFSATAEQQIFVTSANWNGAKVNITLYYIAGR